MYIPKFLLIFANAFGQFYITMHTKICWRKVVIKVHFVAALEISKKKTHNFAKQISCPPFSSMIKKPMDS